MILNKQNKVRLATRPLWEFLRQTQRELNIADCEIAVAFVTDAQIAKWNESYRKKSGPTDVLSFPAVANTKRAARARKSGAPVGRRRHRSPLAARSPRASLGHSPRFLGDIAIAPETAKRYAKKNSRSLGSEIRVLVLHGILHLMGYDHESDSGQMDRLERTLRRRLGLA